MKYLKGAGLAALTACTANMTVAAGIDRSGHTITPLFEDGRYAEFTIGHISPSISGSYPLAGDAPSGEVGVNFFAFGAAYKADINDQLSYAFILDQPFGADISYPTSEGIISGTEASLESWALTALVRYKFNDNFSLHAGPRLQALKETVEVPGVSSYQAEGDLDYAFGYSFGGAYERKDIALRVALTYNSAIDHSADATETTLFLGENAGQVTIETPQSVNLEFQTGIAADTLVFGTVRWVGWDGFNITPDDYETITGGGLVEFGDDRITYTLGVGRRFTDTFSAAITLGYEPDIGGIAPNLGPTDGFKSVGVAGTYTMDKLDISAGVRYVWIGDATSTGAPPAINGDFDDNTAIGVGLRLGYHF